MDWIDILRDMDPILYGAIGYILGVSSMLFLIGKTQPSDHEKRVIIRRWQDELDADDRK